MRRMQPAGNLLTITNMWTGSGLTCCSVLILRSHMGSTWLTQGCVFREAQPCSEVFLPPGGQNNSAFTEDQSVQEQGVVDVRNSTHFP